MKARSAFITMCFVLSLVFTNGAVYAATFVLEGGINTQESWYSMHDGIDTNLVTAHPYDVVGTMYTEPEQLVTMRIVTEKELDPFIARGAGSFSWNTEGFWEFSVSADLSGVVEVVLHIETIAPLPGKTVIVAGWIDGQESQSWTATVSTGSSPMVLSGGINTPDGWTNAVVGETVDIVTENMFDIVGNVYTDPEMLVNMRVVTEKEQDPVITKGTGSFSWNSEGFWEFTVIANQDGVVEIVLHSEQVGPLPGRTVIVSAWYTGQESQSWSATVSNGEHLVVLEGGINTSEQWYSAFDGSYLSITTANAYDVVGTVYSEPGLSISIRIVTEKEQEPVINKGTGSFSWNLEGYWEFTVIADQDGVVEVVLHTENVAPLPGETVTVSAWYADQTVQQWSALVTSGQHQVFLPLIVR